MIYIVRHGQTNWNIEQKIQGQTDIPLNEFGIKQAENQASKIKDLKIDKIYCSDLKRTKQTAEILNTNFNVPIEFDKDLREVGFGTIEGRTKTEISKEFMYEFRQNPEKFGAETKEHLFNRVKTVLNRYSNSDENILLVTHGGIIHMMQYYIDYPDSYDVKIFLDKYKTLPVDNLDVFKFENDKITLFSKNDLL